MKSYYFNKFENRKPYQPAREGKWRSIIFQIAGVLTIITGFIYIWWRWSYSLNYDGIIFSITLAVAETVSFISIFFFIFNMWKNKDSQQAEPPHYLSDIEQIEEREDRPISVDIFIATYNEDAELLRYTIQDAKKVEYPYADVSIQIHVLDDGRRDGRDPSKENIKFLCEEEGVNYLTRESNAGFKAGNLKNGLACTSGDLFVILDADTRPFPGFLKNTLGYFRKRTVAWVQTSQWFYDTTEAIPLSDYIIRSTGIKYEPLRKTIRFFSAGLKTGEDIYGSDPRQFYEVIQRRRNYHNASFCCGAGSLHRRDAVMEIAVGIFAESLNSKIRKMAGKTKNPDPEMILKLRKDLVLNTDMMPFVYHVSEDLYTSMLVHSDVKKKWESVMHPFVESKLLSPQDIDTFVKQRSRYAEGSIDIALHDNPLFRKGLTLSQRICYFDSVSSYFSCIWTMVFLICPILYFFSHVMPVQCQPVDFFFFFVPFFIFIKITEKAGSWGVSQKRGRQYHICLFWLNFTALCNVISGKKAKFNVTNKSKQSTHPLRYSWPHILIISLTSIGILLNIPELTKGDADSTLAVSVNMLWGISNCYTLLVFVRAAFWNTEADAELKVDKEKSMYAEI
ncbi:MAG: glycosyltransferase [Bacteroidota bacterium]|nr:glycosyltransferase [Bacteroidota bacterium]